MEIHLRLTHNGLCPDHLIFIQIRSFECTKSMQMMFSFCDDFISNIFLNLKIFCHDQHLVESFASQILIIRSLGTKSMKHRKSFSTKSGP